MAGIEGFSGQNRTLCHGKPRPGITPLEPERRVRQMREAVAQSSLGFTTSPFKYNPTVSSNFPANGGSLRSWKRRRREELVCATIYGLPGIVSEVH